MNTTTHSVRASLIERPIFECLNESHTYILFVYNFLIVVCNKYSVILIHISHKVFKWDPLINYQ